MSTTTENTKRPVEAQNPQIEKNFSYHPPQPGQQEKYESIRAKYKELAYLIEEVCPPSRERAIAMTELEQSHMMANAAIARNP